MGMIVTPPFAATCSLPEVPNGSFRELTTERPLDPAELIGHGTLVELVCAGGFQVQGQPELRCWQGGVDARPAPRVFARAVRAASAAGRPLPGRIPDGPNHIAGLVGRVRLRRTAPAPMAAVTTSLPHGPIATGSTNLPATAAEAFGNQLQPGRRRRHDRSRYPWRRWRRLRGLQRPRGPPSGGDAVPRRATPPPPSDKPCSAPERLHNALAFRSSSPSKSEEDGEEDSRGLLQFPHGTEVVFRCIDSAGGGERSTWKLLCEDGSWLGRPEKCEDGAQQLSVPKEERRNRSCVFRNTEPNLEAFQGDRRITDDTLHFPPVEKPPTILFRPHVMPVAQSNDGKLVVYPGAILHLECLWLRKYGTPKWEVSHKSRKYAE
ncbi:hypothetical protein MRX96_045903, partial [Rhipicephalus microplus]